MQVRRLDAGPVEPLGRTPPAILSLQTDYVLCLKCGPSGPADPELEASALLRALGALEGLSGRSENQPHF